MAKRGNAETLAVDVWTKVRREVLDGELAPGEKLKLADLARRFEVSNGVVREAMTRLVEQGLVVSLPNRGFEVVTVSTRQLQDLTEFRITVEQLALRWAMERGGLDWESDVVAAHHRLLATPRRVEGNPEVTAEGWSKAHREFHQALVQACGFSDLLDQCSRLFDSAELYRRWSAPASRGKRDVDAEHEELMRAVLARDTSRALASLRNHYQRTADIVTATGLLIERDTTDGAHPAHTSSPEEAEN